MIPRVEWLSQAACAGMDQRAFFANGCHSREQVRAAQKVCDSCPVRAQCADYAVQIGEKWGVWGGMSQKELRQKRHRFTSRAKTSTTAPKPAAKKREPARCGTNSGYYKHLREKTETCVPCRRAHADADARLRRTGSTKAAA
jgi:hypothetical protein